MEVVYGSTNNVGTVMMYKKGTTQFSANTLKNNIGTCAALTTMWMKNMSTGAPENSKPEPWRASIVFAKNWITKKGQLREDANVEDAGLRRGTVRRYSSIGGALRHAGHHHGYWLIELTEGHYVGIINQSGPKYFYDSNQALYRCADQMDMRKNAEVSLVNFGWSSRQDVWLVHVYPN